MAVPMDDINAQHHSRLHDKRPSLPGYSVGQKLGESPDAVTWKSIQLSLDRVVVIKVLKPSLMQDEARIRDFIARVRTVARLKHPAVIQVYDVSQQGDTCVVVTEYIDGDTLQSMLRDHAQPLRTTLYTARTIAELLQETHKTLGMAHGAIHPGNIMYSRDGTVKLADLGMLGVSAKQTPDARDLSYQAPELDEPAAQADYRSDMYSLGAVMYHMLTGHKPFGALHRDPDGRIQRGDLDSPRDFDPGIPPGPVQILRRLMMKAPADRYPDWSAVVADLKKAESGKPLVVKSRNRNVTAANSEALAQPDASTPRQTAGPLRMRRPAAPQPPVSRPRRYGALRFWLWVVLLGWWGGLTWYLLEWPPRPELRHPPTAARPAIRHATTAPAAPAPMPPAEHPARPDRLPPHEDTPAATVPVPVRAPSPAPAERRPEATDRLARAELESLTEALLDEDMHQVRQRLRSLRAQQATDRGRATIDQIEGIIESVADRDRTLRAALQRRKGEQLDLQLAGQRRSVMIRAVEDDAVLIDLVSGQRDTPVLTPRRLPLNFVVPADRIAILGEPRTPAEAAIHFVLQMEALNYLAARETAAACGPLAEAFTAVVEQRIRMLTQ